MNCKQTILYAAAGEALVKEHLLPLAAESSLPRHVENDVINLYPQVSYQQIQGFGCSMTESAAYLLSKMQPDARQALLHHYFSREGLGMHFVRVHLDSCDYSLSEYQAVEDPMADPELATFSLKRDETYILPMLRQILEIAEGNIQVLLSPWSPPACWKTPPTRVAGGEAVYGIMAPEVGDQPSRCNGGSLKPEFYPSWAKYMVKFVKAYREAGIPVTMLSVQNEEVAATNWDSCVWTAREEQIFIRDHLYPEMQRQGIANTVKLLVWDHNKERVVERTEVTFSDPGVRQAVGGIAFHWYSGDHFEAVDILRRLYPEKLLISSECCEFNLAALKQSPVAAMMGLDKLSDGAIALREGQHYARDILGNLNAGMHRWIDWNLVLDENGGPRHVQGGGFTATVVAKSDGTWEKKLSAHYVEQLLKAIRPGAVRIGFTRYCDDIQMTAAKNPDGSIAAVVLNQKDTDCAAWLRVSGQIVHVLFPAKSLTTLALT